MTVMKIYEVVKDKIRRWHDYTLNWSLHKIGLLLLPCDKFNDTIKLKYQSIETLYVNQHNTQNPEDTLKKK